MFEFARNKYLKDMQNNTFNFHQWLIITLSMVIFILIITFNIILWPIPDLGFQIHPITATIIKVDPGRSADQAGIQVGDQMLSMYGIPWAEVIKQPNMLSLIGPSNQPVSVRVQRTGTIHTYTLAQGSPTTPFQMNKAMRLLVALLCWVTGYILGVVRRHESSGSPLIATFWLGLSYVLGSLFFAVHASYNLSLAVYWFTVSILIPLMVYIHAWFPARTLSKAESLRAQKRLVGSWIVINILISFFIIIGQPSLSSLVSMLGGVLSPGLLIGFIGSGTVLYRAYRKTETVHIRRQIRLIGMACFFVAAVWIVTLILPKLLNRSTLIGDYWIDLATGVIPLAYLIGGVAPDLYRVDRVVMRLGIHVATVLALLGLIIITMDAFGLQGTELPLWGAVLFVVLYGRIKAILIRIFSNPLSTNPYATLHHTARELTTKLETAPLVEILCAGIKSTFDQPAMAFYVADPEGTNELTLMSNERLADVPNIIPPGTLTEQLSKISTITESRTLVDQLNQNTLTTDEERALRHPRIVLWCPIRHTEGHLLGLLLLGMRGDFDPYRGQDIRELQRLIHAAVLAFSNSAAYALHRDAEAMIRQLYHQLQNAQDQTAAAIARELHDEIINFNVRLNIESLQKLLVDVHDSTLRDELALVLEGERNVSHALRVICEQLHPTGIDDPLGLPSVLRLQVEKIQANWAGKCRLIIENNPCPLSPQAQHEALRIVREALINVVKHAEATEVIVRLKYPMQPIDQVTLSIQDNGTSGLAVKAKSGHFGIRNMEESARAAGGKLRFYTNEAGTTITFSFASMPRESDTQMRALVEV
jgi:signal transduction histidine kinase